MVEVAPVGCTGCVCHCSTNTGNCCTSKAVYKYFICISALPFITGKINDKKK